MLKRRPPLPRPDRRRSIQGSFSWIDHRFLREQFDQGLTRLEKLLYFVLVALSNQDGVSFYSDARLGELLDIHYPHELLAARQELVARDLIAYDNGIYQVLQLSLRSPTRGRFFYQPSAQSSSPSFSGSRPSRGAAPQNSAVGWESLRQLLDRGRQEADLESSRKGFHGSATLDR